MKLKVNYSELTSVLGYVNTVLSDKTVDEKTKNVIFLSKKDEVVVVGPSPLTFSRTKLVTVETEGYEDEAGWDFQIKASELNKILSCFASLNKTKVDTIEFSLDANKVKVVIKEEALDGVDSSYSQVSVFRMDNIPIIDKVNNEIHTEFPEDVDSVLSGDLLVYFDSLFPLMNNDQASSLSSKMNFSDEYVFVMSSSNNTFFTNALPDAFKEITLGYSSINFLKKLCDGADSVDVQKSDKYLCIKSGNTEAFLKYQRVSVKADPYVKRMSNDNGIVLDRLYLKDVLKRMGISNKDGFMKMTEFGLEASNDTFRQVVPVLNKKGSVDDLSFRVSVPVFAKTIVGDDNMFSNELFIYFVKAGTGYVLYIMDKTGRWFSTIQVRA